jgi:hypothetical protein
MKQDLSAQERAILADGFEGDFYRVLKKLLDNRRRNVATLLLEARDVRDIDRMQGAAQEDVDIHRQIKDIYNSQQKK